MKSKAATRTKTVDSEYRTMVTSFENAGQLLKDLQDKYIRTRTDLSHAIANGQSGYVPKLKDELFSLKENILKTQQATNESDYFLLVGPTLFNYFKSFESCANNDADADPYQDQDQKPNSILNFFGQKTSSEVVSNRGQIYEEYMERVDKNFMRPIQTEDCETCSHCNCKSKQLVASEGLTYCNNCNTVEKTLLEVEKPSYKEPPTEVTYYAYKRINHLNEWLNQVQGKEYTDIPQDIIDNILIELNKKRITDMSTLTAEHIKNILRKLKTNKYYEHSNYILYKLTGICPPRLGEELEEQIRQIFMAIEEPYLKHAPPDRRNFISYSYVIVKALQLLGRYEFVKYFPLLKSRDKLHLQETIWKKMCKDLGWEFIKSI